MLTIPKIRDLVNSPVEKYQHIFDTIGTQPVNYTSSSTNIDLLPTDNDINEYTNILPPENTNLNPMKNELKNFLKKQLHSNSNNNDDVMGFSDTASNVSNFSTY